MCLYFLHSLTSTVRSKSLCVCKFVTWCLYLWPLPSFPVLPLHSFKSRIKVKFFHYSHPFYSLCLSEIQSEFLLNVNELWRDKDWVLKLFKPGVTKLLKFWRANSPEKKHWKAHQIMFSLSWWEAWGFLSSVLIFFLSGHLTVLRVLLWAAFKKSVLTHLVGYFTNN